MSLTYQRSRITGAGLVAAQYDLTLERQTIMDNILFIPGIANPVAEIRQLLFGAGQPGGGWIPSFSQAMIAANSFGSGVTDILDLSGNNNPFSQATPSSRGAWFREPKTGRRNLLLHTEQFDNVIWVAGNSSSTDPTVTINQLGPDGVLNAVRLDFPTEVGANQSFWGQTIGNDLVSNTDGYASVMMRSISGTANNVVLRSGGTEQTVSVTEQWQEFTLQKSISNVTRDIQIKNRPSVSGNGDSFSILLAKPQFERTAFTAYQRVTTAFDVTESGQRDCFGVRADGIDDGYATAGNVDFSGTDAVTIFAAMRKVGTTSATFCELSVQADTNNGAFYLRAPLSSTDSYDVLSRGTANARLVPTAFPSPITNILTAQFRISTDFANLRVDGTSVLSVSTDQGSGNYGNYPLFLMARNNTTSRFNGDLYALIIAGGSYPLSTIQRVERLLSRITPTVNL
jgi:hypothetical protein